MKVPGEYFIDRKTRENIPYEGWYILNPDGSKDKDTAMDEHEGPLRISVDVLGHGNWHSLYNLVDADGNKLLSKCIRKIKILPGGFYLLEDNNEDELINRGDVRGGFRMKDYVQKMNVMRPDGTLLSEEWFDSVIPETESFICNLGGRSFRLDRSGNTFHSPYITLSYGCVIVPQENGTYSIYDSYYKVLSENIKSVLFSYKGIWNINILSEGKRKEYLSGQAPMILNFVQGLLIRNDVLAMIEREGMWYILEPDGKETGYLVWDPHEAL